MNLFDKNVNQTPLFQAVMKICRLVKGQGGRALLVGGCVRDAIRGDEAKDFDLEIHGLDGERLKNLLREDFEMDEVGISFGILKIKHLDIDISLPRRENKIADGHRGFQVMTDPFLSLEDSSARRDFTINAIMYDPLNREILDPWNGQTDLKNKILRHVSGHFREDPLRVLRAMQFAARFSFSVAPETVEICSSMRQEELPEDRLAAEWEKLLLKGKMPSKGLLFLKNCGWIRYYPELKNLNDDEWEQTLSAMDRCPELLIGDNEEDLIFTLTVLCHKFHSPLEKEITSFIRRIWRKNGIAEQVIPLAASYDRIFSLMNENAPDPVLRRLALTTGGLGPLHRVCQCLYGRLENHQWLDIFLNRAKALGLEKNPPVPILLGRHLQERGIKPGPEMGKLLSAAFEAQLDGVFFDLPGALQWLCERQG